MNCTFFSISASYKYKFSYSHSYDCLLSPFCSGSYTLTPGPSSEWKLSSSKISSSSIDTSNYYSPPVGFFFAFELLPFFFSFFFGAALLSLSLLFFACNLLSLQTSHSILVG